MTLAKLKEIEAEILQKNPNIERHLTLYPEDEKRILGLKNEHQRIQDRIDQIWKNASNRKQQEHNAAGFFQKLFINKNQPELTESELTELASLRQTLETKFKYGYDSNKYQAAFDANERLKRLRQYISPKEQKEAKRKTERAVIAAYHGKSRELAGQVKSEIRKQTKIDSHCPYCGNDIGSDPHCDHIYPVAKGGLSTPQNMVYVCADCNMKKTALTLTQFIKKYGYNRSDIEHRLEILNKEY